MAQNTSFRNDLALGLEGQKKVSNFFNSQGFTCKILSGTGSDFMLTGPNGRIIKGEIKTDTYDMYTTPNAYMEKISNTSKNTLGGPWKAKADGSELFVYFFLTNFTIFIYDTEKLVAYLDENLHKYKQSGSTTNVRDGVEYKTIGYAVPRFDIRDFCDDGGIEI